MMRKIFVFFLIISFQQILHAQGSDAITGLWITPGDKSVIHIEKIKGYYTGKILRLHPEAYINGVPPRDVKNVDSSLRSRSLEGIAILTGISYNSKKDTWQVRQIYDPERGKYYEGHIVMQGTHKLKLRGHVPGKKWLGETQIWKRREELHTP
jgi:uncharacterized protein (DUF2147 family)